MRYLSVTTKLILHIALVAIVFAVVFIVAIINFPRRCDKCGYERRMFEKLHMHYEPILGINVNLCEDCYRQVKINAVKRLIEQDNGGQK